MSEVVAEGGTGTEGAPSGDTPAAGEFTPITSQEALDATIKDRLVRERGKFKDYNDLKAAKAELDKIKAENQTADEKAAARLADLESKLAANATETLRLRVATQHKITDADDIRLFLTGTDEETLTEQAQRLSSREADRTKNGNRVPGEGRNQQAKTGDERETVRALFGNG
jgi:hypothetical protein